MFVRLTTKNHDSTTDNLSRLSATPTNRHYSSLHYSHRMKLNIKPISARLQSDYTMRYLISSVTGTGRSG